jgi:DNA-directed RNA polymerase specialized sigma24 family protein
MLSVTELNSLFKDLSGDAAAKSRAVGSLYSKLSPILFKKMRYRYRALNENDIHDILQDAFLKIYSSKSLPKSAEALPGWVFAVVENAALDLFRKAYKKNEIGWPQDSEGNLLDEVEMVGQAYMRNRWYGTVFQTTPRKGVGHFNVA